MGTVRGLGGGGKVMLRPWISWFEAFLLHNGEPEEGRLPQHSDGPGMGDWSQTDIIHLETQHHRDKGTTVSVVEQPDTHITVHAVCPLPLQKIMRFLLSRRIRLTIHIKYKCYMLNISFSARYSIRMIRTITNTSHKLSFVPLGTSLWHCVWHSSISVDSLCTCIIIPWWHVQDLPAHNYMHHQSSLISYTLHLTKNTSAKSG